MMRVKWLLLLAACLSSPAVLALSTDGDQPVQIEADRAHANDKERVTIYQGDVIVVQGSIRITGDEVTIHYDDNRKMTKLVAVGKPARFRQLPDGDTEYEHAQARRMEYYADQDLVVLLGDAESWQGKDRISAQRIVYDTLHSEVTADNTLPASMQAEEKETKSRVKVTIVPKKDCPDEKKDASGQCP